VLKTFSAIFILSLFILTTGCGDKEKSTKTSLKVGSVVENDKSGKVARGWYKNVRPLPADATNIIYQGQGWYTFEFKGSCFLMSETARLSVMSQMDCEKEA